jgi:hypothetical protein
MSSKGVSRRAFLHVAASTAVTAGLDLTPAHAQTPAKPGAAPEWALNATIIEACSCNMFCPCYFSTVPSAHGHGAMVEHFCRFNMGYRVNRGHAGAVSLNALKFWLAGDLGADFSKGANWAEITFEPGTTKEQRAAISSILPHVYPVTWQSFTVGSDAAVDWSASSERAEARLNAGKGGLVVLRKNPGMTADPVVISNLRYFGAPRNNGFVLMPNEIQAYRAGKHPFEYKGTNGFMITYDIASTDVKRT